MKTPMKTRKIIADANAQTHGGWVRLIHELQGQDDRVVILLSATFLDEYLKTCLEAFCIDEPRLLEQLFAPEQPLGSLSARTNIAYALGLLDPSVYDDLNTIRSIRNICAHGLYGIGFAHPAMQQACRQLRTPQIAIPAIKDESQRDPKGMFQIATLCIASYLLGTYDQVRMHRRTLPQDSARLAYRTVTDDE